MWTHLRTVLSQCLCVDSLEKKSQYTDCAWTHLRKKEKSSQRVSQPGHLQKLCRYNAVSAGTSDTNDEDEDEDDPLLLLLLLLSWPKPDPVTQNAITLLLLVGNQSRTP